MATRFHIKLESGYKISFLRTLRARELSSCSYLFSLVFRFHLVGEAKIGRGSWNIFTEYLSHSNADVAAATIQCHKRSTSSGTVPVPVPEVASDYRKSHRRVSFLVLPSTALMKQKKTRVKDLYFLYLSFYVSIYMYMYLGRCS